MRSAIGGGLVVALLWAASGHDGWRVSALPGVARTAAGEALTVVDGDTVNIGQQRYRLVGFDTPEIYHAKCGRERDLALIAANRLIQLMREGTVVVKRLPGREKWGRGLARIEINGRDVGETMIAEGLARRYDGRGKRAGWCS